MFYYVDVVQRTPGHALKWVLVDSLLSKNLPRNIIDANSKIRFDLFIPIPTIVRCLLVVIGL